MIQTCRHLFKLRTNNSIRGFVHPSICLSVCWSFGLLDCEHKLKSGETSVLEAFVYLSELERQLGGALGVDEGWLPLPTHLQQNCDPLSLVPTWWRCSISCWWVISSLMNDSPNSSQCCPESSQWGCPILLVTSSQDLWMTLLLTLFNIIVLTVVNDIVSTLVNKLVPTNVNNVVTNLINDVLKLVVIQVLSMT